MRSWPSSTWRTCRPDETCDAGWLPGLGVRSWASSADPQIPPFFHAALRACREAGVTVAPPESGAALRQLPLWRNPSLPSTAVWRSWARAGITRVGHVLTAAGGLATDAELRGRFGNAGPVRRRLTATRLAEALGLAALREAVPAGAGGERWLASARSSTTVWAVAEADAGQQTAQRYARAPAPSP